MRQPLNFWIVGGDLRQATLAKALAEDGHTVHTYALDQGVDPSLADDSLAAVSEADCVVLPLPALDRDGINAPLSQRRPPLQELLTALRPGQLLCAGMASPPLKEAARSSGLRLVDYFAREDLTVANAIPGALAVWLYEKSETGEGDSHSCLGRYMIA